MGSKRPLFLIIFVWIAVGVAQDGWARRIDLIPGSRYTSARGAALGDAVMPLADDTASALFYNPAALGKIWEPTVEPLNLSFHLNNEYLEMLNINSWKVLWKERYSSQLETKTPKFPGVGGAYLPTFGAYGFGFGILNQSRLAGRFVGGQFQHRSLYQFIPTVGYALNLARGIVRIGYSLQWVHMAYGVVDQAPGSDLAYTEGLKEGSGLSHNIGAQLTFPIRMLPSVNIVARNVGNLVYRSNSIVSFARNPSGKPDTEPMTVDVGVGIEPELGRGNSFHLSAVWRDVTNRSQTSLLTRAAGGIEIGIRKFFFLRGGISAFYPSLGFGIKREHTEMGLSWFSEEIGTAEIKHRDIQVLFQYRIRAF